MNNIITSEDKNVHPEGELAEALEKSGIPVFAKFMLAVLGGSASAVGSVLGTATGVPGGADMGNAAGSIAGGAIDGFTGAWSDKDQAHINNLFQAWLKIQAEEVKEIGLTIFEITARLDMQDEKIRKRIESPEYLNLLRKCFRDWSAAESEEKRRLIRNLLIGAASSEITTDDVIRLFIEWIDRYSELHFRTIRAVYNHDGITRRQMWLDMHPGQELPREDSSDADLFKLVVQDLNMGHIIRQHRAVDPWGNFVKKTPVKRGSGLSGYKSAFDPIERYDLTDLGKQFVHYTMSEYTVKISSGEVNDDSSKEKPRTPIVQP